VRLKQRLDEFLARRRRIRQERDALYTIPVKACRTDPLRAIEKQEVDALMRSEQTEHAWRAVEQELAAVCQVEDGRTGAVNPGDRRALFYLVHAWGPETVLEIGTLVGASTVHIAAALRSLSERDGIRRRLITVDLHDVNDPDSGVWSQAGLGRSPRAMVERLGCARDVSFVQETSLQYLARADQAFDFIFLDGDHSATMVYQEVPSALKVLRPGGAILLHDYFPKSRPLWSDGKFVPGPYLATRRLQSEGASLQALPLGRLPWETKKHSHITSLALLSRKGPGRYTRW
jgi:predicted O-methyltransferase YrrM